MEQLYRYQINLFRQYRIFDVYVPYKWPTDGVDILTAQYGGADNVRVQYRGKS